jgi:copper chaperone CopZ
MKWLIEINDMHCAGCVRAVEQALGALPGAQAVAVDLAGKQARVETAAAESAVLAALDDAGFDARILRSEP